MSKINRYGRSLARMYNHHLDSMDDVPIGYYLLVVALITQKDVKKGV